MASILHTLLARPYYTGTTIEHISGHEVYILTLASGEKRCVKILYGEDAVGYEEKYAALDKLDLVPYLIEFIHGPTASLLVTEYVAPSQPSRQQALDAVNTLHNAGYIHGDLTTRDNMTVRNGRALFYDVDSTFHASSINTLDIDLIDIYGTTDPLVIQAMERRSVTRHYT